MQRRRKNPLSPHRETLARIIELWKEQRPDEAGRWHTIAQVYEHLYVVAKAGGIAWPWQNVKGLSNLIGSLTLADRDRMGVSIRYDAYYPRGLQDRDYTSHLYTFRSGRAMGILSIRREEMRMEEMRIRTLAASAGVQGALDTE